MTSSNGSAGFSTGVSSGTGISATSAVEVARGRAPAPRVLPATAGPTFARYLEGLAREGRGCRSAPAPPGLQRCAATPTLEADAETKLASGSTSGPPRAHLDDAEREAVALDDAESPGRVAIDPMIPILVSMAPRALPANAPAAPQPASGLEMRTPMEQLMTKLVRRIAWSGNARTGSARLELGVGELEGATLTIHADDGAVRVALELPAGVDALAWKSRIAGRLCARGLHVEEVEVT
jgi:hypothetical protein